MKAESEIDAPTSQGLPRCLSGNESASNAGDARDAGLIPGSGRTPRGRKWQPILVFLLEKFHGQRSLEGYSPWSRRAGHN